MKNYNINWEKRGGLIPTIIQDYRTFEVLTLAYSSKESFEKMRSSNSTYLFSTSRNKIWKKGETSGNTQEVQDICTDCDNDAILVKVKVNGPACHLGNQSCFNLSKENTGSGLDQKNNIFQKLEMIIEERLLNDQEYSYIRNLQGKNGNKVLEKIIEEAGELILAIKDTAKNEIIKECSDLFFHSLVALKMHNISIGDIEDELATRLNMSGILEKKTRDKKIVIIDYGSGNMRSMENCLKRLGVTYTISSDKEEIRTSDLILFPGVGNAQYAMEQLGKRGLIEIIKNYKKPFLGICLGMQLLFDSSEEGNVKTLGIIPGNVKKFTNTLLIENKENQKSFPILHTGWNNFYKNGEPDSQEYFYFTHSYYCPVSEYTLGISHYIQDFSAIVQKNNFFGFQFHPEKSGQQGERYVKEFLINNL